MEGFDLDQLRTEWAELTPLEQMLWTVLAGQLIALISGQSRIQREVRQLWRIR